jgi:hypothetical protein
LIRAQAGRNRSIQSYLGNFSRGFANVDDDIWSLADSPVFKIPAPRFLFGVEYIPYSERSLNLLPIPPHLINRLLSIIKTDYLGSAGFVTK